MKGKKTCETLKSIRQEIAKANGIAYTPRQCNHKGDCKGTCPACEAEVKFLEQQLKQRTLRGKAIVITGVASSLIALSACESQQQASQVSEQENDSIVYKCEVTDSLDTIFHIKPYIIEEKADTSNAVTTVIARPKNAKSEHTGKTMHINHEAKSNDEDEDIDVCGMIGHVERPKFIGGTDSLIRFLKANLIYPCHAKQEGIIGRVIVRFTIYPGGKVSDVKVVKSVDPELDNEALRAVKLMDNKWEYNGHRPYRFHLPIQFSLDEKNSEDDPNYVKCDTKITKTTFEGGSKALRRFILENMEYPDYEFDNDIEGTARVAFTVTKKGTVENAQIIKSTGNKNLDKEAIRLVNLTSGKWIQPCEPCGAKGTENAMAIRFTTWAEYE